MIGLDGSFLKVYYRGQLLSAVGGEPDAIVDSDTNGNWKWFLELLHQDLGGEPVCK